MATTRRFLISSSTATALRDRLRRHGALIGGALLFLLALALRLYRLGAQSLWLDEGGTWAEITGKGWLALLAELWSPNAAYPLYHLLLKAWVGLAGDSEWALRFPSALAGAGAVAAIYLAARELGAAADRNRAENQQGGKQRTKNKEQRDYGTGEPGNHGTSEPQNQGARDTRSEIRELKTQNHALERGRSLGQGSNLSTISALAPLCPFVAGLLMAVSPFALWQAQDAKVYSLLILVVALLLWSMLRALRHNSPGAWLLVFGLALASVFVHRLALLALAGVLLAYVLIWPGWPAHLAGWAPAGRWSLLLLALLLAGVGVYGVAMAVGNDSRGGSGHIAAGPLLGLWLTLAHFSLDRGDIAGLLGLPLAAWALPSLALAAWGLALLIRDVRRRHPQTIVVLCLLLAPLLLFAIALIFAPIYESRYTSVAFPAWILLLVYPLAAARSQGSLVPWFPGSLVPWFPGPFVLCSLFFVLVLANTVVLLQPQHGLFSGAPVKEQWREGIADLARRAHPDDLVIVQPYYVLPMWEYYVPRVTPDPLPRPAIFTNFGEGDCAVVYAGQPSEIPRCYQRRYEQDFNQRASGKKRMLMLIAPEHARTVDPPKTLEQLRAEAAAAGQPPPQQPDRYGWLGLRFQFAHDQRTWPCGGSGDAYIGVEVMCASFPESYRTGQIPQPAVALEATFGGQLGLRGYTIAPAGGALRPGGTLPITLYWQAAAAPTHNYTMFLHLCRDCTAAPLAQDDGPPLGGYFPAGQTTTWRVGDPVHDERAIPLPRDLPPGRYTLLLGVYPAGEPTEAARLPVLSDAQVLGGARLVLGEVEIGE